MNIAGVQVFALDFDTSSATRADRLTSWTDEARVASPMAPYPRYAAVRNSWTPDWPSVGVVVTADDGSQGLGIGRIRQVSDNPAFASVSPIRKPARICP